MNTDEKILQALEELRAGQKALNGKVDSLEQGQKALQGDVASLKEVQQQQGNDLAALKSGQQQHGKLLNGIAATMASVLEEQQAQRIDIRSLHTELHESREELKGEIRAARAEAKMNNVELQAQVRKKDQSLERRVTNLEEQAGIENPEKH